MIDRRRDGRDGRDGRVMCEQVRVMSDEELIIAFMRGFVRITHVRGVRADCRNLPVLYHVLYVRFPVTYILTVQVQVPVQVPVTYLRYFGNTYETSIAK